MRYVIKRGDKYFTEYDEEKRPLFLAGRARDALKFETVAAAQECATYHIEFHGYTVEETDT